MSLKDEMSARITSQAKESCERIFYIDSTVENGIERPFYDFVYHFKGI